MVDCITNNLIIRIEGKGTVSFPSGEYCDDKILTIIPSSAQGYFFKEWIYDTTDISEDGISLTVPMSQNRDIKAVFESTPGYEIPDYSLFYCPSETNKVNTIDFDYKNDTSDSDPENTERFHFRAIFYSDINKRQVLYTTFSLSDNKRWYYNDGFFRLIPTDGVRIDINGTMDITYDPEILPQELIEKQKEEIISGKIDTELALLCGSKYYVDIEVYRVDTQQVTFIKSSSIIVNCDKVDSFLWIENNDKNNWLCSGQGNSDLKVSGSMDQSLFPDIASNNVGIFEIVWQSRRNDISMIYGAEWDSENDLLYSAGQGIYDKKQIEQGYNPIVLKDLDNNFYISANNKDSIFHTTRVLSVVDDSIPTETTEETLSKLCFPGQTNFLTSVMDNIKVRVYEEDIKNSIVINNDKVLPVVDKQSIRLDIDGVSGAYAIRLRDSHDSLWSSWINIDSELSLTEGEDETLSAYKIDTSRFIVPWEIDKVNGVRGICCQLLTLYGISPTICTDIFVNIDSISYTFEFYKDSDMTSVVPIYDGYQVLSLIRDSEGAIIGNSDGESIIYFKVIFSEDILKDVGGNLYYNKILYTDDLIKFNVVQQGINDIYSLDLQRADNKTFKGEFNVYQHDGVFNVDGRAFVQIIFPDTVGVRACTSDISDPYNLMISDKDAAHYQNLDVEKVYEEKDKNKISKALNINSFKQFYDKDDDNFKFGNPRMFLNN